MGTPSLELLPQNIFTSSAKGILAVDEHAPALTTNGAVFETTYGIFKIVLGIFQDFFIETAWLQPDRLDTSRLCIGECFACDLRWCQEGQSCQRRA